MLTVLEFEYFMQYISILYPLNDIFVPFIHQKRIPQPQIDGIRYIERVSGSFGSNIIVLVFSVVAILELCKLGAFTPGKVGKLPKKLQWGI